MYEHLVVFKFKDHVTKEIENELITNLLLQKDKIKGIVDISAGRNTVLDTSDSQGYTVGLRITFEDLESLQGFYPHPYHRQIVDSLEGQIESIVIIDYLIR